MQVEFNKELKRQKLVEEQLFAKLWEEDRLAKERREAQDEKRQRELVENTRLGLDAQVTSIQAQREAARRMKEEEARVLVSPFKRPVVTGFTGAVVFPLVKRVCLECGAGLLSSFSRLKSHCCLVIDTQKCIEGQARSAWRRMLSTGIKDRFLLHVSEGSFLDYTPTQPSLYNHTYSNFYEALLLTQLY